MSDKTAAQKSLSSSLKTAWMRFLSSDLNRQQATGNRQQATGNYTHFLNNRVKPLGLALLRNVLNARQSPGLRVNYQIAQFHNSISFIHSLVKTPGVPVRQIPAFNIYNKKEF
jgi:hypothetical protein